MKEFCKLSKKDIAKEFRTIAEDVRHPKFVCIKCARAAENSKRLCKPVSIDGDGTK